MMIAPRWGFDLENRRHPGLRPGL